ncbi:MAG TPA: cation diffusion facilitator family transporter, partial [Elusimicrobiales bacterium]|nr:cation diffusion facilitator family transporter [Elusimicrobiales bacterium]
GLLVLFKFLAGILGHSQAMIADSIHSLSDEFATIVTFIALKVSDKPADKDHPYGHGNIEVIISWFVAISLLLTGIYLGYSAIHSITHKHYLHPNYLALWGAIISIVLNEFLYRYTIYVAKLINSPVLKANAYDHRSDAFSSIGAALGITGAIYAFPVLDSIAGIIISMFIIRMGLEIIKDTSKIVMNTMPPESFVREIKNLISKVPEIEHSYKLRIHSVGRKQFMDVSIKVDKDMSVFNGHQIATNLKTEIIKKFPYFKDVIVHVEPHKN